VVGDGTIRGEVADQGNPAMTAPQADGKPAEVHLGLDVVDQLTSRWGVYEGSTHVWFELSLDR
jgi:hypothetical protein